jgi:hypothetical protein
MLYPPHTRPIAIPNSRVGKGRRGRPCCGGGAHRPGHPPTATGDATPDLARSHPDLVSALCKRPPQFGRRPVAGRRRWKPWWWTAARRWSDGGLLACGWRRLEQGGSTGCGRSASCWSGWLREGGLRPFWWPCRPYGLGLAAPISAPVLVGVAMAAGLGDGRCFSQRRGGASGSFWAPCWRFCGDGGCWLPPGLRAGGESSAVGRKSSPVMVGMMAALLGYRSPR